MSDSPLLDVTKTIAAFLFLAFWLSPVLIALRRRHPRRVRIAVMTLLGVTWPMAMIWAFTGAESSDPSQSQDRG